MIEIAPSARVSALADIEDSTRGTRIVIGPGVVVDSFVKIKPAGGAGDVIIGPDCVINSGCVLYTGNGIRMGARVAVAANCTFAPANHEFRRRDLPIRQQGFRPSKGGILIEDDVWIGSNCVLLDGAVLREGCVIAAGSVVRGEVAAFSIQGGHPMRVLGWREDTGV
ncbi:acyltransferase [Achromobacter ruhlandii]|uniref:acyltransferase n=1 Tax=Achromobacter ruhlandii TaxID=72557 RepID=UPI003B9F224E